MTAPITQRLVFTIAVLASGCASKSNTLLLIFHIGFNKSLSMNVSNEWSRHYWLYAACTLRQYFLIHIRPTPLNKLLVGMWTCMPRFTAAKRCHLSESLWGDADVSYYPWYWNFALFQSMTFGFIVAPSILHLHLTSEIHQWGKFVLIPFSLYGHSFHLTTHLDQ